MVCSTGILSSSSNRGIVTEYTQASLYDTLGRLIPAAQADVDVGYWDSITPGVGSAARFLVTKGVCRSVLEGGITAINDTPTGYGGGGLLIPPTSAYCPDLYKGTFLLVYTTPSILVNYGFQPNYISRRDNFSNNAGGWWFSITRKLNFAYVGNGGSITEIYTPSVLNLSKRYVLAFRVRHLPDSLEVSHWINNTRYTSSMSVSEQFIMQEYTQPVTLGCVLNTTYDPLVAPSTLDAFSGGLSSIQYFGYDESLASFSDIDARITRLRSTYNC